MAADERTGHVIHLPSPVVETAFLREHNFQLKFPPRLGEDNSRILGPFGYNVDSLRERGII